MPWFGPARCTDQPSTSGQVVHGQSFTISGFSGAGNTMPVFAFNGGVEGELEQTAVGVTPSAGANSGGGTTSVAGAFNYQRFTFDAFSSTPTGPWLVTGNDSTRGKCLLYHLDAHTTDSHGQIYMASYAMGYKFNTPMSTGAHYLMTWWMFGSWSNSGSNQSQLKYLRLCNPDQITDSTISVVNHVLQGQPSVDENTGSNENNFYGHNQSGYFQNNGSWQRIEYFVIPGTNGVRNGQINIRVFDGSTVPAFQAYVDGSSRDVRTQQLINSATLMWNCLIWQNGLFNGTAPNAGDFGQDDHYVSEGTFARVEMWNSPTPASATHREPQRPTAWADTSITVKINQGSFPAGTAYIVVLGDALTDTVIASQQITLGSGPG